MESLLFVPFWDGDFKAGLLVKKSSNVFGLDIIKQFEKLLMAKSAHVLL